MSQSNLGLYLSNETNKNELIKQIISDNYLINYVDLNQFNGALFSTITLNHYLDEEINHDKYIIKSLENSNLNTMSSGQQKKALLEHLLAQHPQFLILDDIYSNIDKKTQSEITKIINQLSRNVKIIQILYRKEDLLDCIDKVLKIDKNNVIYSENSAFEFNKEASYKFDYMTTFNLPNEYNSTHVEIDPLVQFNNISVSYSDKKVVKDINWTIKAGEFWQLIGPNGSGKSTLLSIITGDNPRGYGQDLILFGKKKGSGESIWDIKKQIGYFTPSMIDQFKNDDTVENMIISGIFDSIGLYNKPTDLQKDIGKLWVNNLGDSFKKKRFQELSVGQQRMVMVARAMVKHPSLLILDEPTVELDDINSQLFISMVNAISRKRKVAILYVSHRDEPNLKPEKIFELLPDNDGSIGIEIVTNN